MDFSRLKQRSRWAPFHAERFSDNNAAAKIRIVFDIIGRQCSSGNALRHVSIVLH